MTEEFLSPEEFALEEGDEPIVPPGDEELEDDELEDDKSADEEEAV